MNKKNLLLTIFAYIIWGFLPLYWVLLNQFNAFFILANRIIWCGLMTIALLAIKKQFSQYLAVFKNKIVLRQLVVASLLITANWGIFIWGVTSQKVLEVAIGYYLTPLFLCFGGILFFKEKGSATDISALLLATCGFVISQYKYGSFPFFALSLSLSFSAYSLVKKKIHVDALLAVAVESTLMFIPALLYCIFAPEQLAMLTNHPTLIFLLVGAGAVTALPMVLFSIGVNNLPMIVVGFIEYLAPCINLFVGAVL
ncbi:MAG: EamA family transporter RarD, partial [Clostridiales bacterium]